MPIRRFRMGPLEIVIILVIILIIFGASKVSQVGKDIGKRFGNEGEEEEERPVKRTRRKKAVEQPKGSAHPRMQIFAVVALVVGASLLGVSFGVLKYVSAIGIWGIVVIAVGATLLVLSRRK